MNANATMTSDVQDIGVQDTDCKAEGKHACRRCARTGAFITYVENGIPKGPGGPCFRCGGKGHHDQADRRRNWGFDMHGRRS